MCYIAFFSVADPLPLIGIFLQFTTGIDRLLYEKTMKFFLIAYSKVMLILRDIIVKRDIVSFQQTQLMNF